MNREVAMERRGAGSPVYGRQWSGGSSSTGSSSPGISPAHHRSTSASGLSGVRRTQNVAARAAAARLAQVMASQSATAEEDEDEDEIPVAGGVGFRHGASRLAAGSNGTALGASLMTKANRSPSPALVRNLVEHTPSVRSSSAGRPSISVRSAPLAPPSKTTLLTPSPIPPIEPPIDKRREKRFPSDIKHLNSGDSGIQRQTSALQDELDMLQEENESILEKLRLAEERREEAEARARELEKQVAALGEGVSLEARKEAALRQREAALEAARQTKDGKDEEIATLQKKVESAKEEAVAAIEQLRQAESDAKALQSMTQRMILSEEEMESIRRLLLQNMSTGNHESERRKKLVRDLSDITGEGNIESMLSVEKGLRELASLKVEDAVVLALAQHWRPNFVRQFSSELSQEEIEDVTFKQAWLIYFWRRAKAHGVEEDIADERLQSWIGRIGQPPTSHDVVDVERGLMELKKLGIEQQLWEASRREIEPDT
ncbi:hypothetical protein C4D60_Mb04t00060 [Musa balbisiana]|uniref:Coiled-coil domain-containing protein SCD2 n=1 Tax=Musa balbisiana TaxID=52838 RepID=A0A4S8K8M8_MUSBA|nr:hypothetical protein C4D60_Mb04t00060 [Musa balbisiana]